MAPAVSTPEVLPAGADCRLPAHRRPVFDRFYDFHLAYRSHPGAVYYLIPHLRASLGWDDAAAWWFAFLNGHTQNPVTSLLIHRRFPTPDAAGGLDAWFTANRARLPFDTDRRHHRPALPAAAAAYLAVVGAGPGAQARYWHAWAGHGFPGLWAAAIALPTFGRLSAWSFLEYLRIVDPALPDADTLMLDDRAGSASHRNGLAILAGLDGYDWHPATNPGFAGHYPPAVLDRLDRLAADVLAAAAARNAARPWAGDVSLLTLESALCTYKSWHRPRRRYPNVYNDLLYDRIRTAQRLWPDEDLSVLWQARVAYLPARLRLEDNPYDPGCVPVKQDHYRLTGEPIMLGGDYPELAGDGFAAAVAEGRFGLRRDLR